MILLDSNLILNKMDKIIRNLINALTCCSYYRFNSKLAKTFLLDNITGR